MSEQALTDPEARPVLGESRARVLDVLRAAGDPVGVQDIAEQVGLHPNTARFHLDGLVDAGLAERRTEERSQPGRPRTVYAATAADAPAGQRSYRLLAEMLTSLVADTMPEPGKAAETAGEAWGRYLAERPAPSQRVDAAEAVRRLSTVLADAGFAPDEVADADRPVIRLRHCPFREVAEQHRDVVCSLHLGLMRGVLDEVRAPLKADRLEPFVEPSLCLAHLAPASARARGRRAR
ncbi:helix-turn-helix domain-containing protein [Amycolatopsis sp. K13G38]|uniref:Helix-turn-helix domain-containing protein n=1 Tax=Amycolatopsis acididurans TaxID=2724524 RepID=A0ABX1J2E2_9PSEU|nr:helix-turn-helix domain-containing protein [Amycolatopsis acididurans]NKQ52441.1 helix-turn-helix domain-containing protein [Amycolatopsis acididurans]